MVIAVIFIVHIIFLLYIFRIKLKKESITSALLNASFIILIFAIGWTIATMISNWILEPEGFGKFFNRDAFALTLLTICEFFFYKIYYKPDFGEKRKT